MTDAWGDAVRDFAIAAGATGDLTRPGSNVVEGPESSPWVWLRAVRDYGVVRCAPHLVDQLWTLTQDGRLGADAVRAALDDIGELVERGVQRLLPRPVHETLAEGAIAVAAHDARLTEMLATLIADAKPEEVQESEIAADKQPVVAAAVIEDGRMVAYADGPPWRWSTRYADIGVLCHPDYRGRGHAVRVSARVSLDAPAAGLIPMYGHADWNTASRRVAEKLGFEVVATTHAYRLGA